MDDEDDDDRGKKEETEENKTEKKRKGRRRKSKESLARKNINDILEKEKDLKDKTDLEKASYGNKHLNIEFQQQTARDKETKLIIINKIVRECLRVSTESYNLIKSEMFVSFTNSLTSLCEQLQLFLFILENKQGFNSSTDKVEERLHKLIIAIYDYNKTINKQQIMKYAEYYNRLETITQKFNNSCLEARGLYNSFFVNNAPKQFNPELKNHNLWPSISDISSIWHFAPLFPIVSFSSSAPTTIKSEQPLHKDELEFIQSLKSSSSPSPSKKITLSREQLNRLAEIKDKCITNINNNLVIIATLKNNIQNLFIIFEHIYNEVFFKNVFEITIIKRFSVY